jgi:threonyl-tRNA synthetase
VGDKEVQEGTVAVRTRDGIVHGEMLLTNLFEVLEKERAEKMLSSPMKSA